MFALPEFDISCALRQPIIFTCLTFMGNILVARTWRIGCIMSVSQSFREDNSDRAGKIETSITTLRLAIMKLLSRISSWAGFIRKKKSTSHWHSSEDYLYRLNVGSSSIDDTTNHITIINLSIPIRLESVEVYEGVYICESAAGLWSLIIGITLIVIPFFLSLLLNTKGDGAVPDQFRELSEIASSLFASCCILIITLPTASTTKDIVPEVYTYLLGASVLSFTLPCCFCIALKRAHAIKSQGTKKIVGKPTRTSNKRLSLNSEHNLTRLKEAEDTAIMGKMFSSMGQQNKAVEIGRGILTLFKSDGEYSWDDGFNSSETRSLGPKELEVVVSTMINSAKQWYEIFQSNPTEEDAKTKATKTCLDALNVFKEAPAKLLLKDRIVVFPGYSQLIAIIKSQTSTPPTINPSRSLKSIWHLTLWRRQSSNSSTIAAPLPCKLI